MGVLFVDAGRPAQRKDQVVVPPFRQLVDLARENPVDLDLTLSRTSP